MNKLKLGDLGIRAGSVEADLAMKINELIDHIDKNCLDGSFVLPPSNIMPE